jgi:hypothetical protein
MLAGFPILAEAASDAKLPEPTRAAAMMALLGIALLGMLLVVVILLGGHWVRRQGSHRRGPPVPRDRNPLSGMPAGEAPPSDVSASSSGPAAETLHNGATNHGETKVL